MLGRLIGSPRDPDPLAQPELEYWRVWVNRIDRSPGVGAHNWAVASAWWWFVGYPALRDTLGRGAGLSQGIGSAWGLVRSWSSCF